MESPKLENLDEKGEFDPQYVYHLGDHKVLSFGFCGDWLASTSDHQKHIFLFPSKIFKMVEVTSFKLWISQVIVLLGLLVFFMWLSIRPKSPRYTITDFSVQKGTIAFALEFENPNKDSGIFFNDIFLTCYNNQDNIGSANISSFSQGKEEITPKIGIIYVDGKLWKALEDQIANRKAQFQAVLATKLRYRTWGIKSRRYKVHLNAQLPVGTDGKIPSKTRLRNGWKKYWRIRFK
ncbi:hypothetical protein ACH5RR_014889 [Cinchona calisaya]|uniref:Late embryogenesis abundant protein LEA-2 subgroup domain-containing protein n=1 Tax=Cinchona calisaya TaxID=153742 RepID=A0ABD2ZUN9_9GENT